MVILYVPMVYPHLKMDQDRFSRQVLQKLFVLNYAPNGMWTYFVSVYFMHNKDSNGKLNDEEFLTFLEKSIGFIWGYAVTHPGVNAIRTPVYAEMVNIVNDLPIEFAGFRFNRNNVYNAFTNFTFNNQRPITKSMLAWWAYQNKDQGLLSLETSFDIEHIFPRARQDKESSLKVTVYGLIAFD